MTPLEIYRKMIKYPMGKVAYAKAVVYNAPYFKSISPIFLDYQEGLIKIKMKNRKSVHNHLGTVHAIAMCNLAELCGGMVVESIIPQKWRWIAKGMEVQYLKKADTDLVGVCKVDEDYLKLGDNFMPIEVLNDHNEVVFTAKINMYVSEKK